MFCILTAMVVVCWPSMTSLETISSHGNTSDASDDIIIEGERVFMPSAAGDDYVDSVQSTTYGTHGDAPPSGMGQISGATTLTEASYTRNYWDNLMSQSTFDDRPADWNADAHIEAPRDLLDLLRLGPVVS